MVTNLETQRSSDASPYSLPSKVKTQEAGPAAVHFWLGAYLARTEVKKSGDKVDTLAAVLLLTKLRLMMDSSTTPPSLDTKSHTRDVNSAENEVIRSALVHGTAGAIYGSGVTYKNLDITDAMKQGKDAALAKVGKPLKEKEARAWASKKMGKVGGFFSAAASFVAITPDPMGLMQRWQQIYVPNATINYFIEGKSIYEKRASSGLVNPLQTDTTSDP